MKTLNPYLNFDGATEEAFSFYKSIFGGEFMGGIMRYGDMEGGGEMSPEEGKKVLHVALPIGNGVLMGTDSIEGLGQRLVMGNNNQIMLSTETKEEADRVFDELSDGGNVEMPMQDMFWGAYYGAFADKFGVNWMINFRHVEE